MRLHFIINERAGNGKGAHVWRKIQNGLNLPYHAHLTKYKNHGREIANLISKEAENANERTLIIAIGGDGTIHEVVNGIGFARNVLVGAIKAGSGNDFSRGFMSFQSVQEIEEFIRKHKIDARFVDCGNIQWGNEKIRFVNNCGIGFDASVAYAANGSKVKQKLNKIGLGKLSYVYYVLEKLLTFECFEVMVEHNGQQKRYNNVWFITVSNQPYFGGGMKISPDSKPDDGLLELSIVSNLSRSKLALMFATVFFGRHTKLKEFSQLQNDRFTLYINQNLPCHTDGEILGYTKRNSKIEISVETKSVKLINKK
ncbi:diacylglycerol/lipid kinase family protein [Lysinibacillus yapensis]|uniref:diacylglycerol/lipid kinase family protein n=1 Tax=Ureibacillus yapensis TaxID=2304605 RepID=UPI00131450B9|nr:diacylglycerol kinase family protein [Lysinibacillus yapensis]